jgi:hypothetical protein
MRLDLQFTKAIKGLAKYSSRKENIAETSK